MRRDRVRDSQQRLITTCLVIMSAVALGGTLYIMRPVLVPLVLAILLAYLLSPLVDFLQVHLRLPRWLAVIAGLVITAVAASLVVMLISSSVGGLVARAPQYQARILEMGNSFAEWARGLGVPLNEGVIKQHLAKLPVAKMMVSTVNSFLDSFSTFFLVLIFVIYLVSGRKPHQHRTGLMKEIDAKIRDYVVVKVAISALTGILVGLFLWIVGLDLAVVFGLLTFLLNFIPNIGSVIATLLPLPLALVQFESGLVVALVVGLPGTVQMLVGNVLEPKVMGNSLNLHPITVLLSLIFWGMLWGMAGMVLAAPITAVVKIILDRIDTTRPIGQMMSGDIG